MNLEKLCLGVLLCSSILGVDDGLSEQQQKWLQKGNTQETLSYKSAMQKLGVKEDYGFSKKNFDPCILPQATKTDIKKQASKYMKCQTLETYAKIIGSLEDLQVIAKVWLDYAGWENIEELSPVSRKLQDIYSIALQNEIKKLNVERKKLQELFNKYNMKDALVDITQGQNEENFMEYNNKGEYLRDKVRQAEEVQRKSDHYGFQQWSKDENRGNENFQDSYFYG